MSASSRLAIATMGFRGGTVQGQVGVINDITMPLMVHVFFKNIPVSGIAPTATVYRTSDDFQADFSNNTFVAAGTAVSGSVILPEVPCEEGLYKHLFNPFDFSQFDARQLYYIRYKAVVPSGFRSDLQEDVEIQVAETQGFSNFAASGVFIVGQNPQTMGVTFNDNISCG